MSCTTNHPVRSPHAPPTRYPARRPPPRRMGHMDRRRLRAHRLLRRGAPHGAGQVLAVGRRAGHRRFRRHPTGRRSRARGRAPGTGGLTARRRTGAGGTSGVWVPPRATPGSAPPGGAGGHRHPPPTLLRRSPLHTGHHRGARPRPEPPGSGRMPPVCPCYPGTGTRWPSRPSHRPTPSPTSSSACWPR